MLTSMRLHDPVSGAELILWPGKQNDFGIYVTTFEPGFPTIRDNINERSRLDGSEDYTSLIGSRAISLYLKIAPRDHSVANAAYDELMGWLSPRLRPELIYTYFGSTEERFMTLRGNNVTRTLNMNDLRTRTGQVQLTWVVPEGYQYSYDIQEFLLGTRIPDAEYGRTYTRSYPRSYPGPVSAPPNNSDFDITNLGNEITYPLIKIHGPVDTYRLTSHRTLDTLYVEYSLGDTDYVEIDMLEETITKNGSIDVTSAIVGDDEWFGFEKGVNSINYTYTGGGQGHYISFQYRHVYL